MPPQNFALVAAQGDIKESLEVYGTYGERESKFRQYCLDAGVKRPILAGSVIKSKVVDANKMETILNLITCLPYNMAAFNVPKWADGRKDMKREFFRAALHGVGVAATVYHAFTPEYFPGLRNLARRYDYCSVAMGYLSFSNAHGKLPWSKPICAASLAILPFQPIIVAGVHTLGTEVAVARTLASNPEMKNRAMLHVASAAIAMTCFKLENKYKENPTLHALWHVFGAYAIDQANQIVLPTKA